MTRAAAVTIGNSGKCITEYGIWNNTYLLKSVYLVSADSALWLSVPMEAWISEQTAVVSVCVCDAPCGSSMTPVVCVCMLRTLW